MDDSGLNPIRRMPRPSPLEIRYIVRIENIQRKKIEQDTSSPFFIVLIPHLHVLSFILCEDYALTTDVAVTQHLV
jgi:hypothetical protein